LSIFKAKEKEYRRPFVMEHMGIEIWETASNKKFGQRSEKYADGHIPLSAMADGPQWHNLYRLDNEHHRYVFGGKVMLNISLENRLPTDVDITECMTLQELLQSNKFPFPHFCHLFLDFDCSSSGHTGSALLPFPKVGEIVNDVYDNVEMNLESCSNAFGDRQTRWLRGSLFITDLRVLFIPFQISGNAIDITGVTTEPMQKKGMYYQDISDSHVTQELTLKLKVKPKTVTT
jgi:hypothetical protein